MLFLNTTLTVSPTTARMTGPIMPSVSSHGLTPAGQVVGTATRLLKLASV